MFKRVLGVSPEQALVVIVIIFSVGGSIGVEDRFSVVCSGCLFLRLGYMFV